jgi:hypothetical protein
MAFNEFLYAHNNFIFEHRRTLSYPYRKIVKLLRIDFKPLAIPVQEYKQSSQRYSLIAVLKGMVLYHKVKQDACLFNQRWI